MEKAGAGRRNISAEVYEMRLGHAISPRVPHSLQSLCTPTSTSIPPTRTASCQPKSTPLFFIMQLHVWLRIEPPLTLTLEQVVNPRDSQLVFLVPHAEAIATLPTSATEADARGASVARSAPPGTVVRWRVVEGGTLVFISSHGAPAPGFPCNSDGKPHLPTHPLKLTECDFHLDALRATLWYLERPNPASNLARLSSPRARARVRARGFERLRMASPVQTAKHLQDEDDEDDEDEIMLDDDEDEDEDMKQIDSKQGFSLTSPSLSLPVLPNLPAAPLVSPGTSSLLKRQRSLRPLDLDILGAGAPVQRQRESDACRKATAALSRVRDWLYVGGIASANLPSCVLKQHRIVAIVNLAAGAISNSNTIDFAVTRIYAKDAESEDAAAFIPAVCLAAAQARSRNGAVLIHCHRGVSRSAAMAAAALMSEEGISTAEALRAVRGARSVASPNPAFVIALQALQRAMEGRAPERIGVLARLDGDPGDGAWCIVDSRYAKPGLDTSAAWAAVVHERADDAGVLAVRGPLVHDLRWRECVRLAEWLAQLRMRRNAHNELHEASETRELETRRMDKWEDGEGMLSA